MTDGTDLCNIGKGQHALDSEVLSNESAVEEPFNNIIGMVLQRQRAIGLGEEQLHDLVVPFEQDLLQIGYLGAFQKSAIFCNWSPTEISDKNWRNLFNPMPKNEAADKSHAASVFNKGITLSFERLSGQTCYAFRQHKTDGRIKRQVFRFGVSLDEADGSDFCCRYLCNDWDKVSINQRHSLESNTPIKPLSDDTSDGGLQELWKFFSDKAKRHGTADDDFFATAFVHIRTVAGKPDDEPKPLLTVNEDGELCFLTTHGEYEPLRSFYEEAYMYQSSDLTAPVKHVRAIIQGKKLDLTNTVWNKIAAVPSQVFQIHDLFNTHIGNGQCKALTDEEIASGVKPGVRIALKNSTKFVNANPMSFFDDRMCDEQVQIYSTKKSTKTLLSKMEFYMDKGTQAQRKVVFGGGGKVYLDPLLYMDKPPSYDSSDFKQFLDEAIEIGDSRGGKHLLCQALAYKTYSIIELKVEMLTNPKKTRFISQPAGHSGYTTIAAGLGAIYRAITEITFREAQEALRRMRESTPAPAPALAPPPTGTIMPYTPSAPGPEPEQRVRRNRARRSSLNIAVLGGGETEHHSRPKKKSKVREERDAVPARLTRLRQRLEKYAPRLEQRLKEYVSPQEYDDQFAPLMNELKEFMLLCTTGRNEPVHSTFI